MSRSNLPEKINRNLAPDMPVIFHTLKTRLGPIPVGAFTHIAKPPEVGRPRPAVPQP